MTVIRGESSVRPPVADKVALLSEAGGRDYCMTTGRRRWDYGRRRWDYE